MEELADAGGPDAWLAGDFEGNTALHLAVWRSRDAVVEALLEYGYPAKREPLNQAGESPLHVAIGRGRAEIAKALIEAGADPGLRTAGGQVPFQLAVRGAQLRALYESGTRVAAEQATLRNVLRLLGVKDDQQLRRISDSIAPPPSAGNL